jgi:hypothetical protein
MITASTDQPWLTQKRWLNGHVRDSSVKNLISLWIAAFILTAFTIAIGFAQHADAAHKKSFPIIIPIIMAIVALLFLIGAIVSTLRRIRYGSSTLDLVTFPGVIGGQLVGIVHTTRKLPRTDAVIVRLACFNQITSGAGKNSSTYDKVLWSDEARLAHTAAEDDPAHSAIPIAFTIPSTCLQTDWSNRRSIIHWRLTVTAKEPGLNYSSMFDVPIYKTADSTDTAEEKIDPLAAYRAPAPDAPTERGVRWWTDADGTNHLQCRAFRNIGAACMFLFFGLIFGGAGAFLFHRLASNDPLPLRIIPAIIAIPFSLIGLVAIYAALSMLIRTQQIDFDHTQFTIATRYIAYTSRRTYLATQLRSFAKLNDMTVNGKQFFVVNALVDSNKSIQLATSLTPDDADWMISKLTDILAIPTNRVAFSEVKT